MHITVPEPLSSRTDVAIPHTHQVYKGLKDEKDPTIRILTNSFHDYPKQGKKFDAGPSSQGKVDKCRFEQCFLLHFCLYVFPQHPQML